MKTLQDYINQVNENMELEKKASTVENLTDELDEVLTNPRMGNRGFKPGEEPAYRRKDRGHNFPVQAGEIGVDMPEPEEVRPEDVPAYLRKERGENFPVTQQQLDRPRGHLSDLATLRKLAGM